MIGSLPLRILATVMCLAAAPDVWAGKVEELSRILLQDSSYKVRVQAALLLGKLGDPAAADPLSRALADENKTVRGMAAQSLGKLKTTDAAPALKALLERERDPFVRGQVQKALASLGPMLPGSDQDAKKIYLTFGSFAGGTKTVSGPLLELLKGSIRKEVAKLATVTFSLDGVDEKTFLRSGRKGFLVDGNVTRLDDGMVAGVVEINCDVKVMVARWPSKSIILWTNAGAAVQGGIRDREKENARRDCLEASAGQLGEDLAKFFASQGGQ